MLTGDTNGHIEELDGYTDATENIILGLRDTYDFVQVNFEIKF